MSTKIKADEVLKCFEIIKALEDNGIKVTDWDSQAIELQFPDGEKKRMTRIDAGTQIARIINFNQNLPRQ